MIRIALATLVVLAACATKTVELGNPIDAAIDAPLDASLCRCRITPCRIMADCAAIGGACGGDGYCVGDLGVCSTMAQCTALDPGSVCTASSTSTLACP